VQNNEAARSNLMDLDVASEITKFTSAKVLSQIGVSTLSQANQLPEQLTRLFQ
jgi:flagellin